MAIALDTRRAGPTFCMKMNGITTGNVESEHEKKHADGTQPIVLAQVRAFRRLGQLHQPSAHRFQFRRLQDRRDHRRQRVCDEALGLVRIGGLAHGQVGHEALALFGEAAHQIQHRIDDAPGHVAPERADEHRANIIAAGLGDAE